MQEGLGRVACAECAQERKEVIAPLGHTMQAGECTVCGASESVGLSFSTVYDEIYNGTPLYVWVDGMGECADTDLVIPTEHDGLPVIGIYDNAFKDVMEIKSVYADVSIVKSSAFLGCTNLKTIALSSRVSEVESYAFAQTAFYTEQEHWIDDCLYLEDILLHSKAAGECRVKDGTRVIANSAFSLGDGHTLTKVILPESVQYIGAFAFAYKVSLSEVVVGKNVREIGVDILLETAYEQNEENWKNDGLYLGDYLLKIKEIGQTKYVVADGTRLIADSACACHDTLTHISLPTSLRYINRGAFTNCYKLVEVQNLSDIPLIAGKEIPSGLSDNALHIYEDEL
jgi:hypothetical protein